MSIYLCRFMSRNSGLNALLFIHFFFLSANAFARQATPAPPPLDSPAIQSVKIGGFRVNIDCERETYKVSSSIWDWRKIIGEKTVAKAFKEACHSYGGRNSWNEKIGEYAIARPCSGTCFAEGIPSSSSAPYTIREYYCLANATFRAEALFYSAQGVRLDRHSRLIECTQGDRIAIAYSSFTDGITYIKVNYSHYR